MVGTKQFSKIAFVAVTGFILIGAFQNCTNQKNFSSSDSTALQAGNGGGYGGKPYIEKDSCGVRARVFYQSATNAVLTRDNCADFSTPENLEPSRFQLDPATSDRLILDGRTFVAEAVAPVPQTNLSNPSFENGLAGWGLTYGTVGTTTVAPFSGAASGFAGPNFSGAEYDITAQIQPGRTYRVSAHARMLYFMGAWGGLGFKFWDAGGVVIDEMTTPIYSPNFIPHSLTRQVPALATRGAVFFWTPAGTGIVEIDDIELVAQ